MSLVSPIVCFGAGSLGRRVAAAIRPALMCDNNRSLWGRMVEGVPVESPKAAIDRYPEATFVVTIWSPSRSEGMQDHINQLYRLGARKVVPFYVLLSDYKDALLPHLFWERPDYYRPHEKEANRARGLLDSAGQQEFDRQMRLRMGDFSDQVIDSGITYFLFRSLPSQ